MLAIPSRHRSLKLLGAVLAAQILLLAIQIKREQQVRLIRIWAVEAVAPFGRATAWIVDGVDGGWSHYIALRHTRQQNEELQAELNRLKMRNAELEGRAAEADRLSHLLGFRDTHADVTMLAARVIGASPDTGSRIIFVSRGSRDGVKRDMGVITPEGVVGKILAVYPDTSQVLLLSDKDSGVGALLTSTRTQGPVRGNGDPLLEMEYVGNDVKVQTGESVLTSGQDRIFPKDLPVGTVSGVKPDPHNPFQIIAIKPAAHLDQLEEVLVLMNRQEFVPAKSTDSSAADPPSAPPSASKAGVHPVGAPAAPKPAPKPVASNQAGDHQ
jgi:rod shape-determining protein MreC